MKTAYTNAYRCLAKDLDAYAMNTDMTMDGIGSLHGGVAVSSVAPDAELMSGHSPHHGRGSSSGGTRGGGGGSGGGGVHPADTPGPGRRRRVIPLGHGVRHGHDTGRQRGVPAGAVPAAASRHERALRHVLSRDGDERHLHHLNPAAAAAPPSPPCRTSFTITTITTTTSGSPGT
ncbi:one cut domain family member 2 isoform X1 [Lates japonicus]